MRNQQRAPKVHIGRRRRILPQRRATRIMGLPAGACGLIIILVLKLLTGAGFFAFWNHAPNSHNAEDVAPSYPAHVIDVGKPQYSQFHTAYVYRVIDGDTIVLDNGDRVRLIGVDAPEMGFHGGEYEDGATVATEFVRKMVAGQRVWLEPDGDDTDRFGRFRRYIWLAEPSDPTDEAEIRRYMLNAILLERGYAQAEILGTPRNAELFLRLCTWR